MYVFKAQIMDEGAVGRALKRMSYEILEQNRGTENLVLVGIRRRGVPLARLIAANIARTEGVSVPVGELDITFYRDDITEHKSVDPIVAETQIPCGITGRSVVLVDDVIYTGRTVRAAIDALFARGRPAAVRLAVLIDRGHRELPIRADCIGKNVPTAKSEMIVVHVPPFDEDVCVQLHDFVPTGDTPRK